MTYHLIGYNEVAYFLLCSVCIIQMLMQVFIAVWHACNMQLSHDIASSDMADDGVSGKCSRSTPTVSEGSEQDLRRRQGGVKQQLFVPC